MENSALTYKILDFKLASHLEICQEIGRRLKEQRLAKNMKQTELAARAGVNVGTVRNIEGKGQASLESLVRIATALGLTDDLFALFRPKAQISIAEMEAFQSGRRRAR